jgi:hypothetical protein
MQERQTDKYHENDADSGLKSYLILGIWKSSLAQKLTWSLASDSKRRIV